MELFASRLKHRAAELGIAHAEAARRAGLAERRYAHYVSGLREPDLATLTRIARALQTTPDALLGFDEVGDASPHALRVDRLTSIARKLSDDDLTIMIV